MEKKLMLMLSCLFLMVGTALAQTKISGSVLSEEDGEPIIGATVQVIGSQVGAPTDANGKFEFIMPAGKKMLRVSYVGMESKEVAAKNGMQVTLKSNSNSVNEVVVVAYGTAKRQSITGSISVVDSKKMENRISTSVTSALEGAAPGVQVNSTYGEPGHDPTIRIRGIGTLVSGAADPLYIVDGVAYEGKISELNPSDIESMSVLKDASSAALYGNRAANGVILITTKRGSSTNGKPQINLSINQGIFQRGIPEYKRQGANDWMETSWKAMRNYAMSGKLGLNAADAATFATEHLIGDYVKKNIYNADDKSLFDANGKLTATQLNGYDDTDWEDNIERNGSRQEYNLSASAATERLNIFSSVGYLNEKGYVVGAGYERFNGRINSTYTPNKWFKTGINLTAAVTNSNYNDNANSNMYANPFYVARYMAPVYSVYQHNADGTYLLDANGEKQYDTTSPYLNNRNIAYELRTDVNKARRAVVGGQMFGTLTLPYDFSLTVKADLNNSTTNRKAYNNPSIGDGATNNGRLTTYDYQFYTYTAQELLNWNHEYGHHHIDVLLGHENFSSKSKYDYGMNTNMAVLGNLVLSNFITNSYLNGYDNDYETESYLGRARYNYDEKYYADFSFRRDGSSKFHPDNRWGNFYSFGLNWNVKKESFLKDVKWIDQLRARASYGEVGNDAGVSLYAYKALYYIDKNGDDHALIKQSLSANEIKWETTQTVDFGIEGTLFDRLNFSIGYFDKRSKDLLFQIRLPLSAGSYAYADPNTDPLNLTQYKNIGTISNRGFEFSLNGDVIRSKDWTWNLTFDATTLSNKIIKLPEGKDILHGLQNYSEGHSAYEFYTYHFEGVDQMTGNSLYNLDPEKKDKAASAGALVTINGTDYTTATAYSKREWAGTALPSVYGSFGSNLRWKDLSLKMLFTYSLGGKVYDGTYRSLMSTASASSASAYASDLLKSWDGVPAGMTETSADRINPNGIPVLDFNRSTDNNDTSDRWLTSADYFVCKNITLSYNLPKTLLAGIGIEGVTLKAGVENLFTVTSRKGLNPQYSFTGGSDDTYVTARVFNFGLSLAF